MDINKLSSLLQEQIMDIKKLMTLLRIPLNFVCQNVLFLYQYFYLFLQLNTIL